MNRRKRFYLPLLFILFLPSISAVFGWSNGGYSSDPSHPDYGTHDWIAQHALEWLPSEEKQFITDNLSIYLFGTELPDNSAPPDGIGDSINHHVYFHSDGSLQDDVSAKRADAEYLAALNYLRQGNYTNAAKHAGIMTHYIADVAVFSHVMGKTTDWGGEIHHSDYENYVKEKTSTYNSEFTAYLSFDGSLASTTAYNATKWLAYDTTFDQNHFQTAKWMDLNYNWNNSTFRGRASESINLAVNYVADVLSTLYKQSSLVKKTTAISCLVSSPTILEGETVTISGTIDADVSAGVLIQTSVDQGTSWMNLTTASAIHGSYSYTWRATAGIYKVRASWKGDSFNLGATSSLSSLTVSFFRGSLKLIVENVDGNPILGANVFSISQPTDQAPLEGIIGSEGEVSFNDIRAGNYSIRAAKIGYIESTQTIKVKANEVSILKIKLVDKLGSMKVTVIDERGMPLSGVSISTPSTPIGQLPLIGSTDVDGIIYFTEVKTGLYRVQVSIEGYQTKIIDQSITPDAITNLKIGLKILMGTLLIRVVDEKGAPVGEATITSISQPEGQQLLGVTPANGSLKYDGKPGSYTIKASKKGYIAKTALGTIIVSETTEVIITLEKVSSGIPGFSFGSILFGLVIGLIVLILNARRHHIL